MGQPELGSSIAELRAAQGAAYQAEDFPRYFELSAQLVATSPGFAASHEAAVHAALHQLARAKPGLRFVQVGAMDGKRYDPIYAFVKHYGWRGLVLEPLADLFQALGAHYAGNDRVTLVNAALTATDGRQEMTRVRSQAVQDGAVPLWALGLGSFHPERNALGGVGVDPALHEALLNHAERVLVECLTLETLLDRHGLDRFDLLQVDAEGCELDILRQVVAGGHRPAVVHLEHWALTLPDRGRLLGLLGEHGYRLAMSRSDVLAVDAELGAALDAASMWEG